MEIKLNEKEIQIILEALSKQPLGYVYNVFNNIQNQVNKIMSESNEKEDV